MDTIFKDNAIKLLHLGYSVIPVSRNSKIPPAFMKGWDKFSEKLPTEQEIETWGNTAPASNLAIVCGKASKLVCIDIDDDNLLASPFIPSSPLTRRGKKGEARFFQWEPWMTNFSIKGKIDFMANARYMLLPPSIHPDTNKPYEWTGYFKEAVPYEEVPKLFQEQLVEMQKNISIDRVNELAGRNNKLKEMASAGLFSYKSKDEVAAEILEYDLINHHPPLFNDKNETYFRKTGNEKAAAMLFVENIARTVSKVIQPLPETPAVQITRLLDDKTESIFVPVPRTELLMKLQSTTLSYGTHYNEVIALSASLAAMSMLVANRFVLDTKWHRTPANLYLLALAPSGTGKNVVKQCLSNLFPRADTISGYHKTSASFIEQLSQKREMMMLAGEMSEALSSMKNSKDPHSSSMCENLCDVFTSNDSIFYPAMSLAAKNNKVSPSIRNPYLTILGTTTGSGLEQNTNKYLVEKGLLPRFLFLKQGWSPLFDIDHKPEDFTFYLRDFFKTFHENYPILDEKLNLTEKQVKHRVLKLTKDAQELYDEWNEKENDLKRRMQTDPQDLDSFLSRKLELISRIALIDAISEGNLTTVSKENLLYADSVFTFSLHCITEYVPMIFGSEYGKMRQSVLNYIKNKGICKKSEFTNRFRNIPPQDKQKIITDLTQAGSIVYYTENSMSGHRTEVYKFIEDKL